MDYAVHLFPTAYTMQPDELGRMAEERGFESVWFPEHTHIPVSRRTPWPGGPDLPREYMNTYDPFVALMAVAAATRDLKLATGICLIMERDPITTAKEIATLDNLSKGRFIFGIGGGWNEEEMENHGTNPKTRFKLLRERVLAMKAMWTQEEPEFHGQFVDFDPIWSNPKPVQKPHPPVVMGGDGATTFDRVVQFCDGWMPISRGGNVDAIAAKAPELKRRLESAGRDPQSVSLSLFSCPPDAAVVATLERAGFNRVIFSLPVVERDGVAKALDEYAKLVK
jgi:probable F420-dependent oxidoreductase